VSSIASWSRTIDVPSHDGGSHRWHLLDRPGTDPTAPVVVCLHGNPTWSYLWSRLLTELDPSCRVVAPDHLSMGYSEAVGPRRYRDRVTDVLDLLDALDIIGPVWLVAQDWGGAIAMGVAVARPPLVAGMVLSNTGIAVPAGRHAPWLIRLSAAHGLHRFITRTTPLFVRGTPFLPGLALSRAQRSELAAPYRTRERRDAIAGFVGDVPFDDRHESASDIAAVAASLPTLQMPVRLVWGSLDPVFNDDFADDLMHRFADVRMHRIAKGGHLTVLETSIAPFVESAIAEQRNVRPAPITPVAATVDPEPLWARVVAGTTDTALAISDAAADESITHAEFATRVSTYAQALADRGVGRGERIAVLVPPGIDLLAVVYACWRIGAVTVVADRGLGLRGLGAAVRSARVQHAVGPRQAMIAARTLRWAPRAALHPLDRLAGARAVPLADLPLPAPSADDPAAVVFTSGATGPAKGVRYTHRQLCAQRDIVRSTYDIQSDDRLVAAFAPFAVFGPALGIVTGFADMDVTAPATLTAAALDDACRRIDATMVFASPAALANVVRTTHQATAPSSSSSLSWLSRVRLVLSAGAPVPIATLQAMALRCPSASFHTPYGMTEVLPVADISLVDRLAVGSGRGVCVGRPVPGCEVAVLPLLPGIGAPSALPSGVTGEIVVSTPWMSSGYDRLWRTESLARPVLGVGGAAREWHRTGDVGHLDEVGNLWIEGRVVHVVHTVDGPITPVPIEVAVETVAGVQRAAAVGVGPVGVQQLVVVVETLAGSSGEAPASLAASVRAAAAPVSVAAVRTIDHLPVDIRHNAKIDRAALAAAMELVLSGRRR
jgi:acyl-coenzyme A synthetase/AMP-(fatty) acid ligase/pimeloyl-ACP methyl ester carboxylesterase